MDLFFHKIWTNAIASSSVRYKECPRFHSNQEIKNWFEHNFSYFYLDDSSLPLEYRNCDGHLEEFPVFKSAISFPEEMKRRILNIFANICKEIDIKPWFLALYIQENGNCTAQVFYQKKAARNGKSCYYGDWARGAVPFKDFIEHVISASRWPRLIELQDSAFPKSLFFDLIDDFGYWLWLWLTASSLEFRSTLFPTQPKLRDFLKRYFSRELSYSPEIKEYPQEEIETALISEEKKLLDNLYKKGLMLRGQYLLLRYAISNGGNIFTVKNNFQRAIFYHTQDGCAYDEAYWGEFKELLRLSKEKGIVEEKDGRHFLSLVRLKQECRSATEAKRAKKVVILLGKREWYDPISLVITKNNWYAIKTSSQDELICSVGKGAPDLIFAQEIEGEQTEMPEWERIVRDKIKSNIPILRYSLKPIQDCYLSSGDRTLPWPEKIVTVEGSLLSGESFPQEAILIPGKENFSEIFKQSYYNAVIREGNAYFNREDYGEAIKQYKIARNIYPQKSDSYHNMALAYLMLEEYEESLFYYREELRILKEKNQADPGVYYNIAIIFARHYRKIPGMKPKMLAALYRTFLYGHVFMKCAFKDEDFGSFREDREFKWLFERTSLGKTIDDYYAENYFKKYVAKYIDGDIDWITLGDFQKSREIQSHTSSPILTGLRIKHTGSSIKRTGLRIKDSEFSGLNSESGILSANPAASPVREKWSLSLFFNICNLRNAILYAKKCLEGYELSAASGVGMVVKGERSLFVLKEVLKRDIRETAHADSFYLETSLVDTFGEAAIPALEECVEEARKAGNLRAIVELSEDLIKIGSLDAVVSVFERYLKRAIDSYSALLIERRVCRMCCRLPPDGSRDISESLEADDIYVIAIFLNDLGGKSGKIIAARKDVLRKLMEKFIKFGKIRQAQRILDNTIGIQGTPHLILDTDSSFAITTALLLEGKGVCHHFFIKMSHVTHFKSDSKCVIGGESEYYLAAINKLLEESRLFSSSPASQIGLQDSWLIKKANFFEHLPVDEWFNSEINPERIIGIKWYFEKIGMYRTWRNWLKIKFKQNFKEKFDKDNNEYLITIKIRDVTFKFYASVLLKNKDNFYVKGGMFKYMNESFVHIIGYNGHRGNGAFFDSSFEEAPKVAPFQYVRKVIILNCCWSVTYYRKIVELYPYALFFGVERDACLVDGCSIFIIVIKGIVDGKSVDEIRLQDALFNSLIQKKLGKKSSSPMILTHSLFPNTNDERRTTKYREVATSPLNSFEDTQMRMVTAIEFFYHGTN
ncbi:MAG: tetratricopeptide repeat protein, partial [Candidatus Omnitrophica bacterium]|nr:tetratricopeptide repeat protein [Candidatus Omnitrophota bacterium]